MESRREFFQTLAAATAGLAAANGGLGPDLAEAAPKAGGPPAQPLHPPKPEEGRLKHFWNRPVKDLVSLPVPRFTEAEAERHRIYCGLLAALLVHYWNGNKRGRDGEYPWREKQRLPDRQYQGGDYLGHNIACLAVDEQGEIIDFDFNHNEVFSSSVEHAESRLVRRIFSLAQLNDGWATKRLTRPLARTPYSNILNTVTIYTSLESCAQCSGIMALGAVKDVVFLQRDPSQNSIGNILRQLSPNDAPRPIPADALGFGYFTRLGAAYDRYTTEVRKRPFFIPPAGAPDHSGSITSFLCTDAALDLFRAAKQDFDGTVAAVYPKYVPEGANGEPIPKALTNRKVLAHARAFFAYASTEGKRGTPHQL